MKGSVTSSVAVPPFRSVTSISCWGMSSPPMPGQRLAEDDARVPGPVEVLDAADLHVAGLGVEAAGTSVIGPAARFQHETLPILLPHRAFRVRLERASHPRALRPGMNTD